jgi:SOS-response transcriptional repressor LexA
MTSTFAQRIKDLLSERGITQAELARQVGTKQQTISYLIRGEEKTQSSRYTTKIASVLGVNPLWLQSGEGERYAPMISLTQVDMFKDTCQIPIISCEDILKFISNEPFSIKGYLMSGNSSPKNRFAFEIEDNSMAPEFVPGDVVVIEAEKRPISGDYVVAKVPSPGDFVIATTDDNVVVLRKYKSRGADKFELVPCNSDWGSIQGSGSTSESIKIIGVMFEHRRYWTR